VKKETPTTGRWWPTEEKEETKKKKNRPPAAIEEKKKNHLAPRLQRHERILSPKRHITFTHKIRLFQIFLIRSPSMPGPRGNSK
jgi:hypothetical protein